MKYNNLTMLEFVDVYCEENGITEEQKTALKDFVNDNAIFGTFLREVIVPHLTITHYEPEE